MNVEPNPRIDYPDFGVPLPLQRQALLDGQRLFVVKALVDSENGARRSLYNGLL
jgi:hypothetical protein